MACRQPWTALQVGVVLVRLLRLLQFNTHSVLEAVTQSAGEAEQFSMQPVEHTLHYSAWVQVL